MKNLLLICVLVLYPSLNQNLFCQCNVSSDILDDGTKYFMHAKEQLYVNEDLEDGLLTAYFQLIILQHPVDNNKLQIALYIDVGKSGSKQMVVPRQIRISFADGSIMELVAESLQSPRMVSNVFMQQGTFRLNSANFTLIQNKSLSKIVIEDNREGNQLLCTPYKDIMKGQANCIALKL